MEVLNAGEYVYHAADKGRPVKTQYMIEGFPENISEIENPVLCHSHSGQHQFLAIFPAADLSHR